ncbi:MAG: type IV pilus modification protein PilV [Gammaproteobacteria bacterium]
MIHSSTKQQHGFSLIEVLVTIVILSTGMLGIAALYVESLKSGQSALARTKAINLAADMADRIRVNRAGELSYVTNATDTLAAPASWCGASVGVDAVDCTADQMAAYDIWQWKTALGNTSNGDFRKAGLANARGTITRNAATNPTTITIEVQWSEKADDQSYELSFAL